MVDINEMVDVLLEDTRRQNRYNPMGVIRDRHGNLVDRYGRVMEPDWDKFKKRRNKVRNPMITSLQKADEKKAQ